jgi:hypothetical protein
VLSATNGGKLRLLTGGEKKKKGIQTDQDTGYTSSREELRRKFIRMLSTTKEGTWEVRGTKEKQSG